jgi:hypothetical protein
MRSQVSVPSRNSRAVLCVAPTLATSKGSAMPTVEDNRIVETPTEARQAETGHNVRYVLGAGVVALIVAFAIIWFIYFG